MKINFINKLRSSLFLKILLIFFFAMLMIDLISMMTHRYFFHKSKFPGIQRNSINYTRYIINDLGSPPDTIRAKLLADSLNIQIRYEGEAFSWASAKNMVTFSEIELLSQEKNDLICTAFTNKMLCTMFEKENERFLFVLELTNEAFSQIVELHAIAIIGAASMIIIILYFIMQWLLNPLKAIHKGVQELSEGNLDYDMPTNRTDELGSLIRSFNSMAQRIKKMIHAREQLLLDVSHELRSPLTRTKVTLEMLEDSADKKDIQDDIHEMETMITEILETERLKSQYGSVNLKRLDIIKILKDVCKEFDGRRPGIEFVFFPDELNLQVDPQRVKILFKNILANALKYSRVDGRPIEISLVTNYDRVIIAIQDFGIGIPKDDIPFIFEPFYRVDKSRSRETGGYGLGMNLSKKIMEAHGGTVEIDSQLNVGTTVFLTFRK